MNLRRKCKKLKRENEKMLKEKIVPPQICPTFPYRITTLGTSNAVSVL